MKSPMDPTQGGNESRNEPRLEDYIDGEFEQDQALMKVHAELFKHLVQALVDHPSCVKVAPICGEHTVVYEVLVDREDVKRVIGRRGRIADAFRVLMTSIGGKAKKRYILEIVEPLRQMDEIPRFYDHKARTKRERTKEENRLQVELAHRRKSDR